MIEIKRMHTCSYQTALEVWNEGFQGYFLDMTVTFDRFLTRLTSEGISPEHSLIAFSKGTPVGFLLNAFRTNGDRKLAWNGGTGVIPAMRGKGVGKALVAAALDLYAAEKVNIALLEAIAGNDSAITLYKRFGYEVIDELTFLQTDEPLKPFVSSRLDSYGVETVAPAAVRSLTFYRELSPWQTQWQSLAMTNGAAVIVSESGGSPVGYALFKKKFDDQGKLANIALCQCEVAPDRDDGEAITAVAMNNVFLPGNYRRSTYNLRKSNQPVVNRLMQTEVTTFIEQVHMMKSVI
jgi:GNAT superfamily N-acetyltransferase